MRKTSMIVGSLFLLAVCTGCGKSDYAVTPENVALYAQGSSENSFCQLFDAAKDQAKVEEADGTTTYTLAEPYTVDGQDGKITVQFANESWSDCYFTFMFEGEDYLKNAYEFMYAYDQKMQKTYGDPDEARGTPFLTWADSYDNFLSQKEDGDLSYFGAGDTYTVDDDNTEAGIYISADDNAAKVDISVRQYIYRPMMGDHSGTVEVYTESES